MHDEKDERFFDLGSSPVEALIRIALCRSGELLPLTQTEVEAAESAGGVSVPRPTWTLTPEEVLDTHIELSLSAQAPTTVDLETEESFSLAARGCESVSPEQRQVLMDDWLADVDDEPEGDCE